jgi:hypothetical protein
MADKCLMILESNHARVCDDKLLSRFVRALQRARGNAPRFRGVALASPFLLYSLYSRGDGDGTQSGDIFQRTVRLQLLFQQKFASG